MALSAEELKNFEGLLEERLQRLSTEIMNQFELMRGLSNPSTGSKGGRTSEDGTNTENARIAALCAQSESNFGFHVLKAIQRIHEGKYGTCTQCGEEINPERLKAVPHTSVCVQCQKKIEQRRQ